MSSTLYLLDTNMVSYVVNRRSEAARQTFERLSLRSRLAVSAITEGEIRFGIAHRPEAVRSRRLLEEFLAGVELCLGTRLKRRSMAGCARN